MPVALADIAVLEDWTSPRWRLNSGLYSIVDDQGEMVPFVMNDAQLQLYDNLWLRNLVLKGRQQGFSTLIGIIALDQCLFNDHFSTGIIAQTMPDCTNLFRRKIEMPYMALPQDLRKRIGLKRKNETQLELGNGSRVQVSMSMRGDTLNLLHCCLSGDTEVLTKDAVVKNIKDIEEGDLVLNDAGSYQEVRMLVKNRIADIGHPMLSIRTAGYYAPLKLTGNHSVLTREHATGKPIWKQASEVEPGDYLAFPLRNIKNRLRDGCLPFGSSTYAYDEAGKRIPNAGKRLKADRALGFICGFYLAEGSIRRTETTFSVHRNEVPMVLEMLAPYAELYNRIRVYDHKTSLTSTVTVNGKDFADFLARFFGSGADKRIPDAVFGYGRDFIDGLVFGYFSGDGSFRAVNQVQVTSIRRQLIDQLRLLMISLRIGLPAIYYKPAGEYHGRNCQAVWVLKLQGAANWKFREYFGLPLPEVGTAKAKWRLEHGMRPAGRKFWRRGKDHYWARVTAVETIPDEEFVYDIALENSPHNYVTVNGVVHNSEFGKICKASPEKAREIVTGAFKTLGNGQILIVESTAEGEGQYKEFCDEAMANEAAGMHLTEKDFRLHFYGWWRKEKNRLDPTHVVIEDNMALYFDELETKHGVPKLDDWQRAWYVKEAAILKGDMHREEPSYPEEAFKSHVKGAIYQAEMIWLRKNNRITQVPWRPELPVNTFWDFGVSTNNETCIWLHQRNGVADCFIGYIEKSGEGIGYFVQRLKELQDDGYLFGRHYLPHDGATRMQAEKAETREEIINRMGFRDTEIVPRVADVENGIELTAARMLTAYMDEANCAQGIKALDNYVRKYDKATDKYIKPLHNWASNGSDSFRCWAQGYSAAPPKATTKPKRTSNWRVA